MTVLAHGRNGGVAWKRHDHCAFLRDGKGTRHIQRFKNKFMSLLVK